MVDLNLNFACDWFIELTDNKLSDNKLSYNRLFDNNLASKLVENTSFLNQSIEEILIFVINSINIYNQAPPPKAPPPKAPPPKSRIHILQTVLGTDEKNLFDNQELLKLAIISFLVMTFTFDLRVTM